MIGELLKLQSWSVSGKQYQTDNGLLCNCTLPFGGVNVCYYVSDESISIEDEVRGSNLSWIDKTLYCLI